MRYKKIKPQIHISKSDVEVIKDSLKKLTEEGNESADFLFNTLENKKIERLQSELVGYWKTWTDMGADFSVYGNYIECSNCEQDYNVDLSWGDSEKSKMPEYLDSNILPRYCCNCGSRNIVALRPSEYYSYLSYLEDKDEISIKREALKDEVKKYMEIMDFDIAEHVYSTEEKELFEEVLETFELYAGQENIPLFDMKGGIVYG